MRERPALRSVRPDSLEGKGGRSGRIVTSAEKGHAITHVFLHLYITY